MALFGKKKEKKAPSRPAAIPQTARPAARRQPARQPAARPAKTTPNGIFIGTDGIIYAFHSQKGWRRMPKKAVEAAVNATFGKK